LAETLAFIAQSTRLRRALTASVVAGALFDAVRPARGVELLGGVGGLSLERRLELGTMGGYVLEARQVLAA